MAKNKKKNNRDSRVTAGDLFSKLGKKQGKAQDEELLEEDYVVEEEFVDDDFDEIDVSSASDNDDSDSDLDINELLRKYMPEYDGDDIGNDDDSVSAGVLSKLKKTAAETTAAEAPKKNEEELLIDALDSAFAVSAGDSLLSEDIIEEDVEAEPTGKRNVRRYHIVSVTKNGKTVKNKNKNKKSKPINDTITEYELDSEDDKPKKKLGFFAGLFGKSSDKAVNENVVSAEEAETAEDFVDDEITEFEFEPMTESEPEEVYAEVDDAVEDDAEAIDAQQIPAFVPEVKEPAREVVTDGTFELTPEEEEMLAQVMDSEFAEDEMPVSDDEEFIEESDDTDDGQLTLEGDEELTEAVEDEEFEEADENIAAMEELDDDIDPTDINLMVAFGLDGGDGKKSDKAKEFGDLLEAKQQAKSRKHVLDRPEYVDKTQTPEIRKEFHDKQVKLWIKLGVCAIFTVLLMVFENITVLTKLFTGTAQQFAGAFDPAVYPVVYIMISLQLMLLACVCAFDEIVNGIKSIFRGTPRPESMTAILTLAGIIYSVVLSHIINVPTEPVMFNFIVALSALMTLIYSIYNNKREMMNFRVVANKKPKHIVRRLLDEESECESKAFADAEDVCDVMKIEKTDFVDGFFGRLRTPDANTGIFMTFIMSASAAIAVLFGIFANIKGGDAVMVARVIYSSMLIIAPLSLYMTFSYPFYRANLAAKEYDSAIIGEASLEEYSNASIISFDDKNVFPSYSVKVQNFRVFNNARIDRVLYYAASAFAYAGGPLQDVFEVVTKNMGISTNVQIFDTEAGFLATQVDGVNIIFGSYDALRSRGLEIDENAAKDDVDISDALEIMYMFRESKLVAKMYIQYVMDGDIDLILKQFSGSGLYVCVRTYDPNIDERMIARKLNMKRIPLKIVRYASTDEVGSYAEKINSGLVTCGTPKSLLQVISYCGKVLHTKKTNIALSVLSVMIGLAILVLLLLSDSMGSLNSLIIAIYQLLWLIPMMISSRMFIR